MGRFRFRLERLARLRALEERVARAAWGAAEQGAREAEAAADEVRRTLAEGRAALGLELARGPLEPRAVLAEQHVLVVLGRRLAQRRQDALTRRGQAERQAEAWRERRARSEALERLGARARAEHARTSERRAASEQDERALARFQQEERLPAPDPRGSRPI